MNQNYFNWVFNRDALSKDDKFVICHFKIGGELLGFDRKSA